MTSAREQLDQALVHLSADGRRPRCGEYHAHHLWLSDDVEDRRLAASWCAGCPVLDLCGLAADEANATWGVWAGVDRGDKPRRRRAAKSRPTTAEHDDPQLKAAGPAVPQGPVAPR